MFTLAPSHAEAVIFSIHMPAWNAMLLLGQARSSLSFPFSSPLASYEPVFNSREWSWPVE